MQLIAEIVEIGGLANIVDLRRNNQTLIGVAVRRRPDLSSLPGGGQRSDQTG